MQTTTRTIDMDAVFREQAAMETDIARINASLDQEKGRLMTWNANAKDRLTESIKAGGSTGDSLQDEIIQCFGLDKKMIDQLLAFSKSLVEAKGTELMIAISYQKHVFFGGCFGGGDRDSDFVTSWGHIFGTLSGERLKLSPEKLSMTIPFSRYLLRGFEHEEDRASTTEPLTIINGALEPSTFTMLTGIMGLEEKSSQIVILVGQDIKYENLRGVRLILDLEGLKKQLQNPTPEELARSVDI